MTSTVDGIILAAGLSTRMGAAKLTLELDGEPIIVRVVRAALRSVLSRVILVVGPESKGLIAALGPLADDSKLSRVTNPFPESGMSGSLHAGVSAVHPEADAAMMILADQPFLGAEVIDTLVAAYDRDRDKIVQPAIDGRTTTPVVFPSALFPQLLRTTGDVGGREVVNQNWAQVVQCEISAMYDDTDLDTPADFEKAAARARLPK